MRAEPPELNEMPSPVNNPLDTYARFESIIDATIEGHGFSTDHPFAKSLQEMLRDSCGSVASHPAASTREAIVVQSMLDKMTIAKEMIQAVEDSLNQHVHLVQQLSGFETPAIEGGDRNAEV